MMIIEVGRLNAHSPGHSVIIAEGGISRTDFIRVVRDGVPVELAEPTRAQVLKSSTALRRVIEDQRVVYGLNTGFGKLSSVLLPADSTTQLQVNLLRSHACAVGQPYPAWIVRGMMLLRLVSLSRGFSGVRMEVLELLQDCLNAGVHPVIPQQGSLGASGDLAPLAHLALVLIGEGEADFGGERLAGSEALSRAGLLPIQLSAKEGLALINGTQAMTSVALLALQKVQYLANAADVAAALTMEALDAVIDPFLPEIHATRPYPEQAAVASRIRALLQGSQNVKTATPQRVQDAYSVRCVPQVHGASLRAIGHVEATLEIEMNAVTDNPLVFPDDGKVLSGGNFHGQPIALAMDYLKLAAAELANISERRIERLVNPQLSGLPAFLTSDPGVSSGLMILQYTAASLVSENKVLAHPASVDSIPSSANQEDHVSMGTTAARQANQIVENALRVIAIELICAAQAADCKDLALLAPATRIAHTWVRHSVPPYQADRSYSNNIETLSQRLSEGGLDACMNLN